MDWTLALLTVATLLGALLGAELLRRRAGNPRAVMLPKAEYSPDRAARLLYITIYIQRCMEHGLRVRFIRPVNRQPYFNVPEGATGALLHPLSDPEDDRYVLRVQLDDAIAGALEFGGEVHWKEDVNLEDFEKEVELYQSAG